MKVRIDSSSMFNMPVILKLAQRALEMGDEEDFAVRLLVQAVADRHPDYHISSVLQAIRNGHAVADSIIIETMPVID